MHAGLIILVLKVAVVLVTVLLVASLSCLAAGNVRLHGRINVLVFVLTMLALIGLEVIARILNPEIFNEYFERHQAKDALKVHLCFSVPSALVLPFMLWSGLRQWKAAHYFVGLGFVMLWVGTLITGVFYLPHELP